MAAAKKETATAGEGRKAALDTALAAIEKQYGAGAIMKLSDGAQLNIDSISTGSIGIDIALGIGGFPRGRITEIYGPESSGKTTVALHCIAEAQRGGGNVGFIDVEHALDPIYASALGVDIDNLLVSQPESGEQALEIAEALIRSGAIDAIVLDSVAAMTTRAEIEGEMGDSHMGLQARLMSQAMRKLTGIIGKTNCAAIFINQIREKIGGMSFGNNETTTGGRALKFFASVRMDIRKGEAIKNAAGQAIGSRTKVKIVKNKCAPPFKECEFDIMYGEGISKLGEILDLGTQLEIITKSGAFYSYDGDRLGQGRDNARDFLKNNPEMCEKISAQIMQRKDELLMVNKKNSRFG